MTLNGRLLSQRTKEALARKRAEGVHLGHRKGQKNSHTKLSGHEEEILRLRQERQPLASIARRFHVHVMTIYRFLKEHSPAGEGC